MKSFIQIPVNGCTYSFGLGDTPSVCGILFFMEIIKEEWREIEGFPLYLVSNYGRVKSLPRQSGRHYRHSEYMLSETQNTRYPSVNLSVNSKARVRNVHRLVAEAFIPNPFNKPQVNHIDGNKKNNHVSNLEWNTAKENTAHAILTGLQDKTKPQNRKMGEDDPNSKSILQFSLHGVFIKKWASMSEAKRELSISLSSIRCCCQKKNQEGGGYFWFYSEEYITGEEQILISKRRSPDNEKGKFGGICLICNRYYKHLYIHSSRGHRLHNNNS